MKTYAISLKRCKERYNYISQHLQKLNIDYQIIDAIDGNSLTEDEINEKFDVTRVKQCSNWFRKGMMACTLSHIKMYQEFLKTDEKFAFFIEDDVILPADITLILNDIVNKINAKDLVLLHYTYLHSHSSTVQITLHNQKPVLKTSNLCFVMRTIPASGAAYLMGKEACKALLENIYPIRAAADSWEFYFQLHCFDTIKVLYPRLIETKHFKSSIDYLRANSFRAKVSNVLNNFVVSKMILNFRRKLQSKKNSQFIVVNEKSPYDK